ncbi:thioredoxin [Phaeacidiphilus oryzae]|uniref:thioredoxin n=1 Tax=Phaeacidiphilus oryzae TaxID=348818 RepID=UPI00056C12E8|nr:thioredoxin [Phaeacidiphilus oryzae]
MATMEMTAENFEDLVDNNAMVLIDFWADWCGPCKQFAPVFEASSEEHPDIVFAMVDTESQQQLSAAFEITSIPTLMVIREKVALYAQPGALPPAALEQVIEQAQAVDMDDVRAQINAAQNGQTGEAPEEA